MTSLNREVFNITFANGYMFFPYGEVIEPELRKAVFDCKQK